MIIMCSIVCMSKKPRKNQIHAPLATQRDLKEHIEACVSCMVITFQICINVNLFNALVDNTTKLPILYISFPGHF